MQENTMAMVIGAAYSKRLRKLAVRITVTLASTYFSLLVAEVWLWWHQSRISKVPIQILERGMYLSDSTLGVVLKPGYDDDARKLIASREKTVNRAQWPPLRSVLLPQFRSLFRKALHRVRTGTIPPNDGYTDLDRDRFVARGLKYTLDLQDLARKRGMGFQVAIVPAKEEVQARAYSKAVARYVKGLRESGLETIEILPHLTTRDYWEQDLHNPQGAKVASETIYRALPASLKSR
jgi:hypothetical protein